MLPPLKYQLRKEEEFSASYWESKSLLIRTLTYVCLYTGQTSGQIQVNKFTNSNFQMIVHGRAIVHKSHDPGPCKIFWAQVKFSRINTTKSFCVI